MSSTMDQHQYLKKYLSSAKSLKKRNKVKKKNAVRVNIIDDDLVLATFNEAVTEDLTGLEVEDAPQIVGVTDERPLELRVNDYKTDMWKTVTVLDSDEEDNEMKSRRNERDIRHFSPARVKAEPRDYDNSPPRRNSERTNDDNNAPNQRKKRSNPSDDDNSPPRKGFSKNNELNNAPSIEHKRKKQYTPDEVRKTSAKYNRDEIMVRNKDNSPSRNLSKHSDERMTEEHRNSRKKVSRWHKDDRISDSSPPRKVASRSDEGNKCDYAQGNNNKESSDNDNNPPRESNKLSRYQETSRIERHGVDDNSPPRRDKQRKDNDKSSSRSTRSDRDLRTIRTHRHENEPNSRGKEYESYKYSQRQNDKSRDSRRDNRDSKFAQDYNKSRNNPSASKSRDHESDERNSSYRKLESNVPVSSRISEPSPCRNDKSITSQGNNDLDLVEKEACESEVAPKTIVRDRKTGRIRNLQEEAAASREKEKEKEALVEKYSRWGKGLKQVDDANEKRTLDLYEMQKPLARYADDTDLENMLKNKEREGDPMLEYLRKKRREKALKDPDAKPENPTYQGDYGPPNRYSIRPGYRWDGVNRSNGFENKYFEVQNARRAHQTESYKWSSEDM